MVCRELRETSRYTKTFKIVLLETKANVMKYNPDNKMSSKGLALAYSQLANMLAVSCPATVIYITKLLNSSGVARP